MLPKMLFCCAHSVVIGLHVHAVQAVSHVMQKLGGNTLCAGPLHRQW
jgi:hypothetical protein